MTNQLVNVFQIFLSSNGAVPLTVAETDDIGFYGIVWRCSHCAETEDNTDSHCVLYTCYRSRFGSRSRPLLVGQHHNSLLTLTGPRPRPRQRQRSRNWVQDPQCGVYITI